MNLDLWCRSKSLERSLKVVSVGVLLAGMSQVCLLKEKNTLLGNAKIKLFVEEGDQKMLRKDLGPEVTFCIPLSSYPSPFSVFLTSFSTQFYNYAADLGVCIPL